MSISKWETLVPGESCYAQFRFEETVLVYPGDQFIVRSVTPVTTIGGGRVMDPAPHKHGTGPRWRERLAVLEQGTPEAIAVLLLEEAFPSYLVRRRLEASPYLWRFGSPEIGKAISSLLAEGRAVPAGGAAGAGPVAPSVPARPAAAAGSPAAVPAADAASPAGLTARLFHGASFRQFIDETLAAVTRRAETDALDPYLTLGELRRELARGKEWPALDSALEHLLAGGDITRTEHGYRVAGAAGADEPDDETTTRLLAQFAGGIAGAGAPPAASPAAETPAVGAAAEAAGMAAGDAQRLVDALVRRGRLVKVGEDLYYPPDRLEALMARLAAAMEAAGQLTLAEARDLLGTSRRYAQALLEHMDSEGMTLRVGDARRLRRRRR